MEENIRKNLSRAGEYFMFSIWIQNQMSDLIILNRNKDIIKEFITIKEKIPKKLKEERFKFWEKDFKIIKKEFEVEFAKQLNEQAKKDLNTIYYLRNAIAHSYISLARNYLLYKPKNKEVDDSFKESLTIIKRGNEEYFTESSIYKLDFSNDEIYTHNFSAIKRLDEVFLEKICKTIKIPHERIR